VTAEPDDLLETDPRFPSGPWTGFYVQPARPGKHWMDLRLTFRAGDLVGTGRDRVGHFAFKGAYDTADGQCKWTKHYVRMHDVGYRGYNEGKGIWGVWEIAWEGTVQRGGFHIWPEAMEDPSVPRLSEEAELPAELVEVGDLQHAGFPTSLRETPGGISGALHAPYAAPSSPGGGFLASVSGSPYLLTF
jgi:hypothetical protein